MNICIAGIHTGIGKTLCSAVLCQALGYDYWKPVQAGELDNSDSHFIERHVRNPKCKIHSERYRLQLPASPHYAAAMEDIRIRKEDFVLPQTANDLLVETAGGLMSPLAEGLLNIDLIAYLKLPVVLVSQNYLGSINHTLLTYDALKNQNIQILGLVFSGHASPHSEKFILQHTKLTHLFSIPFMDTVNAESVSAFAKTLEIKFQ